MDRAEYEEKLKQKGYEFHNNVAIIQTGYGTEYEWVHEADNGSFGLCCIYNPVAGELIKQGLDTRLNAKLKDNPKEVYDVMELCLNRGIAPEDSVANHLKEDADPLNKDLFIEHDSFQAFLYDYAEAPYFDPFEMMEGKKNVDFDNIGTQLKIEIEAAAKDYAKALMLPKNAPEREVNQSWSTMQKSMDRMTALKDRISSMIEKDDYKPFDAIAPGVKDAFVCAAKEIHLILNAFKDRAKDFANDHKKEPVFSFPKYQEEGTLDEIFKNIRNGYYDFNYNALKDFGELFENQNKPHYAAFVHANEAYCRACETKDELQKQSMVFLMDVEEAMALLKENKNFFNSNISMEEYQKDDLTITAFFNAADQTATVAVDQWKEDGTRKYNSSNYTYEEIKEILMNGLEKTANELLFYAIEENEIEKE